MYDIDLCPWNGAYQSQLMMLTTGAYYILSIITLRCPQAIIKGVACPAPPERPQFAMALVRGSALNCFSVFRHSALFVHTSVCHTLSPLCYSTASHISNLWKSDELHGYHWVSRGSKYFLRETSKRKSFLRREVQELWREVAYATWLHTAFVGLPPGSCMFRNWQRRRRPELCINGVGGFLITKSYSIKK